jgi:hypothetical protein
MEDIEAKDARPLTEQERQGLCKMLFNALIEIRMFCREGNTGQAADVAHVFHNLPIHLWSDKFSLNLFRRFLEQYRQKYREVECYNYVRMLDEMIREEA